MKVLKALGGFLLVVVAVALGAYAWASSTAKRNYEQEWAVHEAAFPIPWALTEEEIEALKLERIDAGASKQDPLAGMDLESVALERAVERGRHLVGSRLGCEGCHGADLGGGLVIDAPMVAHWAAPNLTSGEGGVTRDFTAHDWDRAVRHGVRSNGRTSTMPSEEFSNLSDHELSDVVAYIRSLPPVNRDVGPVRFGPVFMMLMASNPKMTSAFSLDHQQPHAVEPPGVEPAAKFGEHLVKVCRGCHGPNLSGGKMAGDPAMPIVANLTAHETGLLSWKEADFVRAMREGRRPDGTAISVQMPWMTYGKLTDAELTAIWAYLSTVPPVTKGTR